MLWYTSRKEGSEMGLDYAAVVDVVRDAIPEFALDNVIDDLEAAIESVGIDVRYSDMKNFDADVSGYATTKNGKPVIVVNGFDSFERRRFTMAHELAHIIMHWGWNPGEELDLNIVEISYRNNNNEYKSNSDKDKEGQANNFAAEFLAPTDPIKKLLADADIDRPRSQEFKIAMIAKKFKISNPAAYYRYKAVMSDE